MIPFRLFTFQPSPDDAEGPFLVRWLNKQFSNLVVVLGQILLWITNTQTYNVLDYGADNTGAQDSTAAFLAAWAAMPAGGMTYAPPGTYTISGDVNVNKAGVLKLLGATINSTAGRLLGSASYGTIDGSYGTSRINFASASPAASLDRVVKVQGTYNGATVGTGTVTVAGGAGGATFSLTQAGLIANGSAVVIAGVYYTVSAFSGTTTCTLTNPLTGAVAPNTGAVSFGIGALLPITGSITAGALSFTASLAASVSGMAAGDRLIVGEQQTDWQRQEWKVVQSVVGSVVTVTTPFRNTLNTYTVGFYRVTPVEHFTVKGLYIATSSLVDDNYGIDAELCRYFTYENCTMDIAKGLAFQTYMHDHATIRRLDIPRQIGRRASFSACIDSVLEDCHWAGSTTAGALSIETGTCWSTIQDCSAFGVDLSGVFNSQWSDHNSYKRNKLSSDGTSIGIYILGGDSNTTEDNYGTDVLEVVRHAPDTGRTPARSAIGNKSINDRARNATRGVRIFTGAVNSEVLFLDYDASVGAGTIADAVLNGGTNSRILIYDIATGLLAYTPNALPREIALTGAASSVTQLLYGTSSAIGSSGTSFTGADKYDAGNANVVGSADLWHQGAAGSPSWLEIKRLATDIQWYHAAAGTADGNLATFWGAALMALKSTGALQAKSLEATSGDVKVTGVTFGLYIKEGANATMGLATLGAGTVVVNTTKVTASSRILLTHQTVGGTAGFLVVSARTAGTSFTILSSNALDTSTVAWLIVEPS